jgi:hypothetical protein
MVISSKAGPRSEYLLQESLRVKASPSLAAAFPTLKSLTVDLDYRDPDRVGRSSQIKYTVKLDHAKSVFRIACPNTECIRGDFDLSAILAQAVAAGKTSVARELRCGGWRNRATIDTVPCGRLLSFTLTLGY